MLDQVLGHALHHLRVQIPQRDGVDRHALARRFPCGGFGEAMHAGFCGGVVGLAELPLGAVDGGDVDDPAPAAFEHAVDEWPGDVENGVEIDAQDRIPIGVAQLAERSIARDARVVDQNVDVVTVCLNEAGQLLAGGMVGHIRAVGDEVVAFVRLGFQPRADAGIAWRVDDEHGMANIVQGPGDGFAQAASAARDQGGTLFSRHCGHRSCPVPPYPAPRPTRLPTV